MPAIPPLRIERRPWDVKPNTAMTLQYDIKSKSQTTTTSCVRCCLSSVRIGVLYADISLGTQHCCGFLKQITLNELFMQNIFVLH